MRATRSAQREFVHVNVAAQSLRLRFLLEISRVLFPGEDRL